MKLGILSCLAIACVFFYSNCSGFKALNTWTIEMSSFVPTQSLTPGLYKIERNSVKLLPYEIRLHKLKSLIGSEESSLYTQLENRKIELGAYDFAKGVSQDLTWIDSRLASWTESLQPYCSSGALRTKYPFPQGAKDFIETALGREINSEDQNNINDLMVVSVSNEQRLELLCYATLSSLEFVAK